MKAVMSYLRLPFAAQRTTLWVIAVAAMVEYI
jgi:hypothetical protein